MNEMNTLTSDDATDSPLDATSIIEAVLFAGGPAVTAGQLAELLGEVSADDVVAVIARLNQHYFQQARPYEIRRVSDGYQMGLRGEYQPIVRRLHGRSREVRLSLAAIEVLALVAYRQPVAPHEIDAIRGIDSSAIVRQLRRRSLLESVEPDAQGDRQTRLRTTRRFQQVFRLTSLDDLPRVPDLEKL
jgi:segregation and condensation protein B